MTRDAISIRAGAANDPLQLIKIGPVTCQNAPDDLIDVGFAGEAVGGKGVRVDDGSLVRQYAWEHPLIVLIVKVGGRYIAGTETGHAAEFGDQIGKPPAVLANLVGHTADKAVVLKGGLRYEDRLMVKARDKPTLLKRQQLVEDIDDLLSVHQSDSPSAKATESAGADAVTVAVAW